jgi:hypothetical protein
MLEFSKYHTSWKIILEPVTGHVVISEVDALMCFVLSKAEKHVPNGELVGTTEMCNAVIKVLHKPRSL